MESQSLVYTSALTPGHKWIKNKMKLRTAVAAKRNKPPSAMN
jgi:hypothetical protein